MDVWSFQEDIGDVEIIVADKIYYSFRDHIMEPHNLSVNCIYTKNITRFHKCNKLIQSSH